MADVTDMAECIPEILLDELVTPRGIALDEGNGFVFVVDSGTSMLHRWALEDSIKGLPQKLKLHQATADVVLNGVAVFQPTLDNPNFDFTRRLFWTEINSEKVRRSTIHGTMAIDLESVPTYEI